MNCQEFQELTPLEKSNFIGSLVHACISDSIFFNAGQKLIKQAHKKGLFNGVTINPAPPMDENNRGQIQSK